MNRKITFVEIVDQIAQSTSTSKRVCELFLRELFATVSQALIDGEDVKIKGIGTFKVSSVKARKSVSVQSGDDIEIAGYKKLSFTPDKALAESVNQPFAQFETIFLDDDVTDEKLAAIDKEYPSLLDQDQQPERVQEQQPEPVQEIEPDPVAEESPTVPEPEPLIEQESEPSSDLPLEPEPSEEKHEAVETAHATPQSRPMLVGIPIDGPSQPVPEPDPVEEPDPDEYFYRPAPRNAYTPTQEQLDALPRRHDRRWLGLLLLGIVIGCSATWLLMKGCSKAEPSQEEVVVQADTVVQADEEPVVVTETITDQNVLSTMAAKHYGSQWFWVYIYEENKDKINNPDNVPLGTVVVIPPAEKYGIDAEDPASIKRAQRRSWELLKGK